MTEAPIGWFGGFAQAVGWGDLPLGARVTRMRVVSFQVAARLGCSQAERRGTRFLFRPPDVLANRRLAALR